MLARTFGSTITLVHVLEPADPHAGSQTTDALGWEITRQEARGYLEKLQRGIEQELGQPVEVRLEQGRPADRIVDVAREIKADLTVLASRGEGGAPAWSLGSTAQQVLAQAHSSIFVAHPSSVSPVAVTPKRVLVPLDGSPRTESALPTAARIAGANGAELLLVHVVQEPLPSALLPAAEDMELARSLAARIEAGATQYLERLRGQLAHEVASVRTIVARHGNARQYLLEISRREQSDMLVLSAHGSACDAAQSFGSVAGYLLTHARVPVLVLQDLPDDAGEHATGHGNKPGHVPFRASHAS